MRKKINELMLLLLSWNVRMNRNGHCSPDEEIRGGHCK